MTQLCVEWLFKPKFVLQPEICPGNLVSPLKDIIPTCLYRSCRLFDPAAAVVPDRNTTSGGCVA
jgi:hypothetical protein